MHANSDLCSCPLQLRRFFLRSLPASLSSRFPRFLAMAILLLCVLPVRGQQTQDFAAVGYITAVPAHTGDVSEFQINSIRVLVGNRTTFGLIGDQTTTTSGPLRNAMQPGAFVKVTGNLDKKHNTVTATIIYFRPDWDKPLTGVGVIDKIIHSGAQPTVRADGYFLHFTSTSEVTLPDGIRSLQDITTNDWVNFQGKQDPSGVILVRKVVFLPPQSSQYRSLFGKKKGYAPNMIPASGKKPQLAPPPDGNPNHASVLVEPTINPQTGRREDFEKILDADGNLTQDAGIRLSAFDHWHAVPATTPADKALQARIHRIGERIVPAYQKALPATDPSKIRFEFYAFDDKRLRGVAYPSEGLILIPIQVVSRLQNDDQIAAILADGVAYNIQRQGARQVDAARKMLGPAIAANLMLQSIPFVNLVPILTESHMRQEMLLAQFEERGRIAMGLLSDAGYDPWQVPEAWRLLESKHAPKDASTLNYNDYAGYLLSVLNLEYPKNRTTNAAGNTLHASGI